MIKRTRFTSIATCRIIMAAWFVKDHLYGFSASILTCMEFKTGQCRLEECSVGKGSLNLCRRDAVLLSETTCGSAVATRRIYKRRAVPH